MTEEDGLVQIANNRFNISLSAPCMDMVNKVISGSCMFNGRADFVFSAIRHFHFECNKILTEIMDEAVKENEIESMAFIVFSKSIHAFAEEQDEDFRKRYPGPMNKQIPIRPSLSFYGSMCNLCQYIFGNMNYTSLQTLCRIAIKRYIDYYCDETAKNCRFSETYKDLKSKVGDRLVIMYRKHDEDRS